jgi:hypothetical protein
MTAECDFGDAKHTQPNVSRRIARTEPKRLLDMSLSLRSAADASLIEPNSRVSARKIRIDRQSPLAFSDALLHSASSGKQEAQTEVSVGAFRR